MSEYQKLKDDRKWLTREKQRVQQILDAEDQDIAKEQQKAARKDEKYSQQYAQMSSADRRGAPGQELKRKQKASAAGFADEIKGMKRNREVVKKKIDNIVAELADVEKALRNY
jgi:pyridoxine 5'-phosphate synthase PdxJ